MKKKRGAGDRSEIYTGVHGKKRGAKDLSAPASKEEGHPTKRKGGGMKESIITKRQSKKRGEKNGRDVLPSRNVPAEKNLPLTRGRREHRLLETHWEKKRQERRCVFEASTEIRKGEWTPPRQKERGRKVKVTEILIPSEKKKNGAIVGAPLTADVCEKCISYLMAAGRGKEKRKKNVGARRRRGR